MGKFHEKVVNLPLLITFPILTCPPEFPRPLLSGYNVVLINDWSIPHLKLSPMLFTLAEHILITEDVFNGAISDYLGQPAKCIFIKITEKVNIEFSHNLKLAFYKIKNKTDSSVFQES